ncbi:TPA: hypothetical protein EYP38_04300, partial [Candidatus Micrarchaeota archaeon]|nr:hypothetical protein [Candidatus Micrarchaeota archaeon]
MRVDPERLRQQLGEARRRMLVEGSSPEEIEAAGLSPRQILRAVAEVQERRDGIERQALVDAAHIIAAANLLDMGVRPEQLGVDIADLLGTTEHRDRGMQPSYERVLDAYRQYRRAMRRRTITLDSPEDVAMALDALERRTEEELIVQIPEELRQEIEALEHIRLSTGEQPSELDVRRVARQRLERIRGELDLNTLAIQEREGVPIEEARAIAAARMLERRSADGGPLYTPDELGLSEAVALRAQEILGGPEAHPRRRRGLVPHGASAEEAAQALAVHVQSYVDQAMVAVSDGVALRTTHDHLLVVRRTLEESLGRAPTAEEEALVYELAMFREQASQLRRDRGAEANMGDVTGRFERLNSGEIGSPEEQRLARMAYREAARMMGRPDATVAEVAQWMLDTSATTPELGYVEGAEYGRVGPRVTPEAEVEEPAPEAVSAPRDEAAQLSYDRLQEAYRHYRRAMGRRRIVLSDPEEIAMAFEALERRSGDEL